MRNKYQICGNDYKGKEHAGKRQDQSALSQATEEVIHKASFALKDESNFNKMTKVKTIFKTKK